MTEHHLNTESPYHPSQIRYVIVNVVLKIQVQDKDVTHDAQTTRNQNLVYNFCGRFFFEGLVGMRFMFR